MKYEAYRVENGVFDKKNYRINENLWEVRGQRETDLNWPVLGIFNTEEEAKAFAVADRKENGAKRHCPIFDNNGYSYRDISVVYR